jgi:hypothetical protein
MAAASARVSEGKTALSLATDPLVITVLKRSDALGPSQGFDISYLSVLKSFDFILFITCVLVQNNMCCGKYKNPSDIVRDYSLQMIVVRRTCTEISRKYLYARISTEFGMYGIPPTSELPSEFALIST